MISTRIRLNRMRFIMTGEISDVKRIRLNRIRFLIETNDDPATTHNESTHTTRRYTQHSREVQLEEIERISPQGACVSPMPAVGRNTLQRVPCPASSAKFLKSIWRVACSISSPSWGLAPATARDRISAPTISL